MDIRPLDPFHPEALALFAASDAFHQALYPAESNHLVGPETLAAPGVRLLGVFDGDAVLACGATKAVRQADGRRYAEVKRVFVPEAQRGQGLARALMDALEAHLRRDGIACARLETGIHQPAAIALYCALGYRERGPFGDYTPDPLSRFFEKPLTELQALRPAHLNGLAALLRDCVAGGASIGWVQTPSLEACRAFWQAAAARVARHEQFTWVAVLGERVLGSVSLGVAQPDNGRHRADLFKLMVHPDARGLGLGQALVLAAEAQAMDLGKRLLVLDTNTDSTAQALYTRLGWQVCGVMPDYAEQADGRLGATTWMFKRLGPSAL